MMNIAVIAAEDFQLEPMEHTVGGDLCDGKRNWRVTAKALRFAAFATLFSLFVTGCATHPKVTVKDTSHTFTTVVIDPGHGGKDPGTRSRARRGPAVLEKVAALDVGLRLDAKLRAGGLHTVMTRRTDVFIPLEDRARISNAQKNAIFVSIHFNDSPKRRIHGIETHYNSSQSISLADKIEHNLDSMPGEADRGVKYANFRVLRMNQYPAVLVECGFLSNKSEAVRAASAEYRDHLADRIAEAIFEQRYGAKPPVQVTTVKTTSETTVTAPE